MNPITFFDRKSKTYETEAVYGGHFLKLLYGNSKISRMLAPILLPILAKSRWFSFLYGLFQRAPFSKRKVLPFIQKYGVDSSEFLLMPHEFRSFDDFFIRRLKPEARLIAPGKEVAIIPADGRYLFYPRVDQCDGFVVKGEKFHLSELIGDAQIAKKYERGTMIMARLCPTDYHRFHFPCDCMAGVTHLINGVLYSVNPIAIKKNIEIFTENKRTRCELASEHFGTILYMEIGAKCVGRINQTYIPGQHYEKGDEKGYFSFGGSSLILFFEPEMIQLDHDLIAPSLEHIEIRCLMGQSMGCSKTPC